MSMSTSCKATNMRGEPCAASVGIGSGYCFWHDPAKAAERASARKRGGYNRRRGGDPTFAERMEGRQFRTLEDMVCLMEVAIRSTLALENSVSRNRTLGYLAGQWARVFEVGELERRLQVLEQREIGGEK